MHLLRQQIDEIRQATHQHALKPCVELNPQPRYAASLVPPGDPPLRSCAKCSPIEHAQVAAERRLHQRVFDHLSEKRRTPAVAAFATQKAHIYRVRNLPRPGESPRIEHRTVDILGQWHQVSHRRQRLRNGEHQTIIRERLAFG